MESELVIRLFMGHKVVDGSITGTPYTETRSRSVENVTDTKLLPFLTEGQSLSADVCQGSPL